MPGPFSYLFSFSPGGTLGRSFAAVTEELSARGHAVTLLVPAGYDPTRVGGVGTTEVRAWPPGGVVDAWRFVSEVVQERRPDAVVGSFSSGTLVLAAGRRHGVPARMVWQHTPSLASRLDGTTGLRWQYLRARRRLVLRLATDVLAATEHVAEDLAAVYGVPPARISVEPFAIPDPGLTEVATVPGRVVCVGRLYPVKGQDWLLRSLAPVVDRVPDLELHVVGDGVTRQATEALARELGLADRCRFLGVSSREAVAREMAEAVVVVCPSRSEGFGLVAVEAAAAGTAVVGADIAAFRSIVEDGGTGLLVPVDDEAALGDALARAITDAELARRLGDAGRRRFEARFDLATRGPEIADRYESLVTRRLTPGRSGA